MAELNKTQMDKAVKDTVVEALGEVFVAAGVTRIDDYTFAFPVNVDGEDTYAKVAITAVQRKDTKVHPAFDLDTAIAKYATKLADREAKAAERAAKKASE